MKRFLITIVILLCGITMPALAQTDSSDDDRYKSDSVDEYDYRMYKAEAEDYITYTEANIKQSEFKKKIWELNYERLKEHGRHSDIIFWVVLIIVFSGLAFSAIQFYIGLQSQKRPINVNMPPDIVAQQQVVGAAVGEVKAPEPTTLKISKDGIEVQSSVLGVIILVISIAFFYLYLTIVYPINPLDTNHTDSKQEKADSPAKKH